MTDDTQTYYIRLDLGSDYLNLLFDPGPEMPDEDTNHALQHLFRQYADPHGTIAYYDPDEFCVVALRARTVNEIKVFQFDNAAPYDGLYIDGRFVESLEGVE